MSSRIPPAIDRDGPRVCLDPGRGLFPAAGKIRPRWQPQSARTEWQAGHPVRVCPRAVPEWTLPSRPSLSGIQRGRKGADGLRGNHPSRGRLTEDVHQRSLGPARPLFPTARDAPAARRSVPLYLRRVDRPSHGKTRRDPGSMSGRRKLPEGHAHRYGHRVLAGAFVAGSYRYHRRRHRASCERADLSPWKRTPRRLH